MIFKVKENSLSVYDPKTESFIAQFQNHIFETDDEKLINRLIELEYKPEEEIPVGKSESTEKKKGRTKKVTE